jgi:hypothetical protein
MSSGIYDDLKTGLMNSVFDLSNDTIKIALMDENHSFVAGDTTFSNTNEISGTGYTAGGETLANQLVSMASNTATFDGDDVQWSGATFSAYHLVIYDTTASNALILSVDFGGEQTVTAAIFKVVWDALGILTLG